MLAACPNVGKTALALTFARNAAVDAGVGVLIFSPKMSKMQVCPAPAQHRDQGRFAQAPHWAVARQRLGAPDAL